MAIPLMLMLVVSSTNSSPSMSTRMSSSWRTGPGSPSTRIAVFADICALPLQEMYRSPRGELETCGLRAELDRMTELFRDELREERPQLVARLRRHPARAVP